MLAGQCQELIDRIEPMKFLENGNPQKALQGCIPVISIAVSGVTGVAERDQERERDPPALLRTSFQPCCGDRSREKYHSQGRYSPGQTTRVICCRRNRITRQHRYTFNNLPDCVLYSSHHDPKLGVATCGKTDSPSQTGLAA